MIEWFDQIDKELFLVLNGMHVQGMDAVMLWITDKKSWIPLYILFVGLIIYKTKWKSIWVFIAIGLLITVADQFTSGLMKPFFERLRPCHNPLLSDLVYNIGKCGGQFGFASSHAANTFAIGTFLWLFFRKEYKAFVLMFVWAGIVSYSRIYVGVHYPGDVLVGAFAGVFFGMGIFWLYEYFIWGAYKKT
ncbi:phosphatase PAP2 family protein [Reichenbachiella sp. MALMAid0571]|uniref:phosphatase PAP2 family protein n=1 Tax=Reichenbachiella sp. MALMAid0571 TaxID=3143939 RepID=UPI0032DE5530